MCRRSVASHESVTLAEPSARASDPGLRVSDAERERVAEALRVHAAEGRLRVEELEQRLASAFSARTHGELAPLLVDLPADRGSGRRHPARRSPGLGLWVRLCLLFMLIWALTGGGYFWPAWPMMGTFIGLVGPSVWGGPRRFHGVRAP